MKKEWTNYIVSMLFMIIGILNFTHGDAGQGTLFFTLGIVFAVSK